jgi:hypothetical protein
MIKGIPQKLLAFEMFLEKNPDWREKVLLVQIAVPTRTDVHEYQRLTSQVHEIVGRINGRFGTLTFMPIHHLDRSLAFHQLCALYAITGSLLLDDIALTLFAKHHLAWSIKVHGCTLKRNMQLFSCQGFLHVYGEEGLCFLIL